MLGYRRILTVAGAQYQKPSITSQTTVVIIYNSSNTRWPVAARAVLHSQNGEIGSYSSLHVSLGALLALTWPVGLLTL